MNFMTRSLAGALTGAAMVAAAAAAPALAQDSPIRVAMGDIASVESLGLLIAMERTEELMRLMEQKHGIEYANIRYVPGAEVRVGAMLRGTINASIVDAAAFRLLQEEGGGKFKRLPIEGVNATDEALCANTRFQEAREEDVTVFVEELLRTWQDINENPEILAELREQYDLLPDLPAEAAGDITAYWREAVEGGVLPTDVGTPQDVVDDLEFLAAAGQVEAPEGEVDVSQYWDFDPLESARN